MHRGGALLSGPSQAPHCKDSTKITVRAPAGLSASALLPTEAALPQAAPTAGHWGCPRPKPLLLKADLR